MSADQLRTLLWDRYDDVIEKATDTLMDHSSVSFHIDQHVACGSCRAAYPNVDGYQEYLARSEHRATQVLAAVLPDLLEAERERASADLDWIARALAAAWDAGMGFVRSHPDMAAEYYRAANPYRKEPR